jgi:hypothetical protein
VDADHDRSEKQSGDTVSRDGGWCLTRMSEATAGAGRTTIEVTYTYTGTYVERQIAVEHDRE